MERTEQGRGGQPTPIMSSIPNLGLDTCLNSTAENPICQIHGTEQQVVKRPGREDLLYCEQCADEAIAAVRDELVAENCSERSEIERKKYDSRYRDLAIGRRFEGVTFDSYQEVCQEAAARKRWCQRYAETFPDRRRAGDSIIMCGKPGTGKNHLAAAICKAVVDLGMKAVHTTAVKLVRKVKETWGKGSEMSEQEAINLFSAPDLLVIDEVGMQFGSQAEQVILMEVINGRYADMRPTILISNLAEEDQGEGANKVPGISSVLGPQVVDRFHDGNSAVLTFGWDSYRRRSR